MLLAAATDKGQSRDQKQEKQDDSFGFHFASQIDGFNVSVP
jgi:hypothetical protein